MTESVRRFRAIRPRTLRQEVGDILREAILSAKLKSGQRLIEDELARDLEISRIPIREALGQLAQQGLVTIVPHQGASVVRPTQAESYEALIVRIYLDSLAVRLAAARQDGPGTAAMAAVIDRMAALSERNDADVEQLTADLAALDWEFHQCLMAASGSAVLDWIWSVIGPYLWVTDRYGRILRHKEQPAATAEALIQLRIKQHGALLEAVRSGDVGHAEQIVHRHYGHALSQEETNLAPHLLNALPWLDDAIRAAKADSAGEIPVADHHVGP